MKKPSGNKRAQQTAARRRAQRSRRPRTTDAASLPGLPPRTIAADHQPLTDQPDPQQRIAAVRQRITRRSTSS